MKKYGFVFNLITDEKQVKKIIFQLVSAPKSILKSFTTYHGHKFPVTGTF